MEECWRMALRISQKAEPAQFLHSSGMFADISSTRAARKQRAIATTACAPVYHIAIYLSMYMYTY